MRWHRRSHRDQRHLLCLDGKLGSNQLVHYSGVALLSRYVEGCASVLQGGACTRGQKRQPRSTRAPAHIHDALGRLFDVLQMLYRFQCRLTAMEATYQYLS